MSEVENNVIKFQKKCTDWEKTDKLKDLVKAAEHELPFLQEDAVGYYYYWMYVELKKLTEKTK